MFLTTIVANVLARSGSLFVAVGSKSLKEDSPIYRHRYLGDEEIKELF